MSDPDHTPTLDPLAGVSRGDGGDSKNGGRSEGSGGTEDEDSEHLSSSYDSDGWPDDTTSIQLGPEDVDLDEVFGDGV